MRAKKHVKKRFAMSSTLIKDIPTGKNIVCDLREIYAMSKEEAIGIYVLQVNSQFPEHYIHVCPLAMEIKDIAVRM